MSLNLDTTVHTPKPITDEERRAQVSFRGYTHGQLHDAFTLVQNKEHWKAKIDCELPALSEPEKRLMEAAVIYFAGCVPTFTRRPGDKTQVRAVGYWEAIGA